MQHNHTLLLGHNSYLLVRTLHVLLPRSSTPRLSHTAPASSSPPPGPAQPRPYAYSTCTTRQFASALLLLTLTGKGESTGLKMYRDGFCRHQPQQHRLDRFVSPSTPRSPVVS